MMFAGSPAGAGLGTTELRCEFGNSYQVPGARSWIGPACTPALASSMQDTREAQRRTRRAPRIDSIPTRSVCMRQQPRFQMFTLVIAAAFRGASSGSKPGDLGVFSPVITGNPATLGPVQVR